MGTKSVEYPEDLNIHAHLKKTHCEARVNKLYEGKNIDWATAEALAFGSLLHEGKFLLSFFHFFYSVIYSRQIDLLACL